MPVSPHTPTHVHRPLSSDTHTHTHTKSYHSIGSALVVTVSCSNSVVVSSIAASLLLVNSLVAEELLKGEKDDIARVHPRGFT